MCRKLIFSVFIGFLLGLVDSVLAFPLKVDIGDIGQTVKPGWEEFSGDHNNEVDPKTESYLVGELTISVSIETGFTNDSGYRDYGGGDLGGDMVYPDDHDGSVEGRVILTLGSLPTSDYTLTSYHNDSKASHAQQEPINVTVSGAISDSTSDLGVVQTKSLDDSNLGQSIVTFTANGTGDVVITYTPTTNNGAVSKAVLSGFQLDSTETTVQFDSPASEDFESVSLVILTVVLSPATPDMVTVDYNVTGGTATAVEDYTFSAGTLTFDPNQTTPEYISISIINDGEPEDDETIEVILSNPVDALLGANAQHTYTILDPRPGVGFETIDSEGREDVSPAYIPVSLSWAWAETVTVDYNVTGGTAIVGEDYNLADGTLVFDPCDLTEYISITIMEDDYDEDPDETIEITLSNPSNAKLGTNTQHTFTILPPTAQVCPTGDLDGNCEVDFNDLEIFALQWLDSPGGCSDSNCADFDGINGVDMFDFAMLAGNWRRKLCPIVVNECMASNDETIADPQDEYNDWIEFYNASGIAVDMGGMWLADSANWWQIPDDRPAETTVDAGGYLLIWADDDVGDTPGLHASFKLSKSGDEVSLYAADAVTLIDSIEFKTQVSDISYGRYPDASASLRFFATPTPGAENVGAYLGEVADTKFSHDRGFYESPFTLSITCNTADANINYTLNGSEPNEFEGDGTYAYSGPIDINQTTTLRAAAFKPGYLPTNVDTQTYIFLDDVVNQPDIDPGVVTTYGSGVVKDALKSIPTLSIAMNASDLANLQDQDSRYPSRGLPKMELPTSAELIYADPNDGEGLQINCAIEGHSWALNKRSFKLIFKSAFGPTQLRYPFFESAPVNADSAVDEFDRIVLRASKNMPVTYAGDQWTRDSQIAMSDVSARGAYVHLYLNGAYWGLYNATERPDAWFTSSYLGGEKEDYFATNHGYERGEDHISGDSSRFDTMISMAQAQNLEDPGNYDTFKGLCDVTNFADYTILFWFSGFGDNIDNNWYASMRNVPLIGSVPPEGLMMFMWDAEAVFQVDFVGPDCHEEPWVPPYYFTMTGYTIVDTWLALHENEDFKMLFADRVYEHCFNGGALTDDNTQTRWDTITDYLDDAAICELARWPDGGGYGAGPGGDANIAPPDHIDMNGFVDIFMTALDNYGGLYPSIDPPNMTPQGGYDPNGFTVTMSHSDIIFYTLDGNDPREPVTGNPVGTVYTGPVVLDKTKHVKARAYNIGATEWSALNEATFAVGPVADYLRITEIMYHPQDTNDPNDPNTEFIELKNISPNTLNLNLVSFTDGISFTFPADINIPGGDYVVVVKDQNTFASRYPGFAGVIAGEYTGRLNNGGERIKLEDAIGQTILNFRYEDGWRPITDGDGFSLTIIDPNNGDPNSWGEKDYWRASAYVGGSPGWDDAGIIPNPGAVVINEVMAHSHLAPDWIELYNTTAEDINIGGWFLSDSDSNLMKYEIAAGKMIGTGQYLVFYEDTNFSDTNDPGCHIPFAFSENGEEVCLSSGLDGDGNVTGYREVKDFGASESNVSFGRYFKGSTGNYNFVAMEANTPDGLNAYPKVGPIVINEIMYHPNWPDGSPYNNEDFEYIELYNITSADVNLYDEEGNPWKFTDGIEFTFPADTNIPAYGYLLVVKDTTAFTWRYGAMPAGVEVLGSYDGKLSNSGEKLEISAPGDVDEFDTRYYIRIDRVNYSDGSHPEDCPGGVDLWPTEPDGGGASLARIDPSLYGNDPNNWDANAPSPGAINP
ncbi:MAG: lamin tail domain-containing protein [Planctomycetota bacterium]